jgi:glutamate decarboxylase
MNQGLPYFMRPLARLLTAMNQNLTKLDASRALSLCERQALAMMHRLVYDCAGRFYERHVQHSDSTLGVVTSGGTVANITALWAARNASLGPRGDFGGVEREGLRAALRRHGHADAVVIGPESMRYSFTTAAGLLGIGERGLLRVPTDYRGRTDLGALRETVAACQARGAHIIAIVGVAGSTDAGAIDPLAEMADVADEANAHFHVDASWEGRSSFPTSTAPGSPASSGPIRSPSTATSSCTCRSASGWSCSGVRSSRGRSRSTPTTSPGRAPPTWASAPWRGRAPARPSTCTRR